MNNKIVLFKPIDINNVNEYINDDMLFIGNSPVDPFNGLDEMLLMCVGSDLEPKAIGRHFVNISSSDLLNYIENSQLIEGVWYRVDYQLDLTPKVLFLKATSPNTIQTTGYRLQSILPEEAYDDKTLKRPYSCYIHGTNVTPSDYCIWGGKTWRKKAEGILDYNVYDTYDSYEDNIHPEHDFVEDDSIYPRVDRVFKIEIEFGYLSNGTPTFYIISQSDNRGNTLIRPILYDISGKSVIGYDYTEIHEWGNRKIENNTIYYGCITNNGNYHKIGNNTSYGSISRIATHNTLEHISKIENNRLGFSSKEYYNYSGVFNCTVAIFTNNDIGLHTQAINAYMFSDNKISFFVNDVDLNFVDSNGGLSSSYKLLQIIENKISGVMKKIIALMVKNNTVNESNPLIIKDLDAWSNEGITNIDISYYGTICNNIVLDRIYNINRKNTSIPKNSVYINNNLLPGSISNIIIDTIVECYIINNNNNGHIGSTVDDRLVELKGSVVYNNNNGFIGSINGYKLSLKDIAFNSNNGYIGCKFTPYNELELNFESSINNNNNNGFIGYDDVNISVLDCFPSSMNTQFNNNNGNIRKANEGTLDDI